MGLSAEYTHPNHTPPTHTHTLAPPLRKIHSGYVNGNVITQPWRIYGPVHTHTNVFMTVSRALCKLILTGARTRLLAPLPRQLSAAAPVAALRLEGCRRTFPFQPRRSRSCCPTFQAVVRGVSRRPFLFTVPTFNIHLTSRTREPPALVLHETNGFTQTGHYVQKCLDFDNIFSFVSSSSSSPPIDHVPIFGHFFCFCSSRPGGLPFLIL